MDRLKAQKELTYLIPAKSIKGFTLLELLLSLGVLSIATAVAVPNFSAMVQNNRIKSTTNSIVSTLQFARQTAVINNTQVTACTPIPGSSEICASTYNWSNGVALLQGNVELAAFTPPPPPTKPIPPSSPVLTLIPEPVIIAEPKKPEPPKGVYTLEYKILSENHSGKPVSKDSRLTNSQRGHIIKSCPVYKVKEKGGGIWGGTWDCQGAITGDTEAVFYDESGKVVEKVYNVFGQCLTSFPGGCLLDSTFSSADIELYNMKVENHKQEMQAKLTAMNKDAIEATKNAEKAMTEYETQMEAHKKSKEDLAAVQKANKEKEAIHQKAMDDYNAQVKEHQNKLKNYESQKQKYDEELASKPGTTVTVKDPNTILASNPFAITVSNNLASGALVYKHDKLQSGGGEIYITDKRGKGEHSRTICVNMLGNIKVVKGNQSCP